MVKLSSNGYEVVRKFSNIHEKNEYRFIRHTAIHGTRFAFTSEIGQEKNKLVVVDFENEFSIVKEIDNSFTGILKNQ